MSGNNNWNWKIIELFVYIAVALIGIYLLITSHVNGGGGPIFSAAASNGGIAKCFFI